MADISNIPAYKISDIAANVSVAYKPELWENDMVFKDQDDCSKRLLCELNAKEAEGRKLTETEGLIAQVRSLRNMADSLSEIF